MKLFFIFITVLLSSAILSLDPRQSEKFNKLKPNNLSWLRKKRPLIIKNWIEKSEIQDRWMNGQQKSDDCINSSLFWRFFLPAFHCRTCTWTDCEHETGEKASEKPSKWMKKNDFSCDVDGEKEMLMPFETIVEGHTLLKLIEIDAWNLWAIISDEGGQGGKFMFFFLSWIMLQLCSIFLSTFSFFLVINDSESESRCWRKAICLGARKKHES